MKFEELSKKKTHEIEGEILKKWKKEKILNKTIENRKNSENFVFHDGPATANGMPGAHHMLAKLLKDTFTKYKTMKGYKVLRKIGWDTHGLPVELEVEGELGFKSKKDIEDYGIIPFNKKCKESVWKNEDAFRRLTEEMGQFIDIDDPYITYKNDYIETEWWILKKFFDEGLIYNGYKILPYCPRCGTGLASHEVAQGYKEVSVNTVTVPFKLKDENTYMLVWTTTPWTLLANVAVAVNPEEEYVKVLSKDYKFIVSKKLANKVLGEDYEIIDTFKGKDLEHKEYEQLLPFVNVNKKAFFVTCADYVTMEDGTGIVHIAPAFGQDDYEVGIKYDLPVINPVGEDGKYTEGIWTDRLVVDSELEIDIIKYLKENDKLFKKEKIKHNYPHCWRCESPLIYYSKPSWYIKVTSFKDKIIEANKKVNWHPDFVGEKRFANWLENANDWAISRSRYWGTPLPLWTCDCGHMHMIGSRDELIEKATTKVTKEIDLHRPYVDDVKIKCDKCNSDMERVKDVIDCWFDSGSMPFAQYHYPFENKELFESQFPADFICEGIDQTRGWFYTLLVISTFVMGKAPYKNVLVNDLIQDKYGKKMSKSKGNALNPFELMENYGADPIRFYMPYVSPVWTPLKFDEDGLKEVISKFFGTLKNTYTFFSMYANTDNVDPREFDVSYEDREEIDKWLISKYNKLVKEVTNSFDSFDLTNVARKITEFTSEDLSNWYIRRNRRRFWKSELDTSKKAVYKTTYEILLSLTKLIAPIASYTAEELYTKLTDGDSVHLEDYPVCNENEINETIENRMDLVREIISLGRNSREETKIKVRQPIKEVLVDGKQEKLIGDLTDLIKEELNVKEVVFVTNVDTYMNYFVKPNFKEVGKIFGAKIKMFSEELEKLTNKEVVSLQNGETLNMNIDGTNYEVNLDMVDIRIQAKEGFNVAKDKDNFIILNTELDDSLIKEGIARELVSKVQNLRKSAELDIADRIILYYSGDETIDKVITEFEEYIKNDVLATRIEKKETDGKFSLNNHETSLSVKKDF